MSNFANKIVLGILDSPDLLLVRTHSNSKDIVVEDFVVETVEDYE